jgi:hypothetical protein
MDPQPAPPADVRQPPVSFWRIVGSIGPGLIISANIVGTGELIGTTRLGADVGFIYLIGGAARRGKR